MDSISLSDPPERGHPDRKRALNVLAQRRYRKRIREKLAGLERIEKPPIEANQHEARRSTEQQLSPFPPISPDWAQSEGDRNPPVQSIGFSSNNFSFTNPQSGLTCLNSDNDPFPFSDDFMGTELQGLEVSQYTFPDDGTLEVPALKLMRISLNAAEKLGCADSIWNPTTSRVLNSGDFSVADLPLNMWPTNVQSRVSHHPLFDILPWPSVRDKLIFVFELPPSQRPPAARDPNAIANLVYDVDDPTEGVRVIGEAGFEPDNWEVGQAFFSNWWWALDRAIVSHSNSMRIARGSQVLRIT